MKKSKLPSLVSILVLTLVTSIIWISFSIYRTFTTKPAESVPKTVSAPLTPTLDEEAINQIKSSIFLDSSQIPETVSSKPTTEPTQAPLPTATPIVTPEASPSATP